MAFNVGAFIVSVNQLEANPPGNAIDFASGWADAFYKGFGKPSPPTLTAEAAKAQMQAIFLTAYQNDDNGKNIMHSGVSVFAAQMAPGMLPLFAAIPPMGYQGFAQVDLDGTTTNGLLGPALAAVTLPWFMSGTAVQTATGATTTWM